MILYISTIFTKNKFGYFMSWIVLLLLHIHVALSAIMSYSINGMQAGWLNHFLSPSKTGGDIALGKE